MNALAIATLPHLDTESFSNIVDPARCALLVIDLQIDSNACIRVADGILGDGAIAVVEQLIMSARAAGLTIAFTRSESWPELSHPAMLRLKSRKTLPREATVFRLGRSGEDLHQVKPEPGDIQVRKPLFDSFHGTDLHFQLKRRGIATLLIAGISTDGAVDNTARRAFHLDYDVIIVSDACAAPTSAMHKAALGALERNVALLVDAETAVGALSRFE